MGHKVVTARGAIVCGCWHGNRGGAPRSNALKCPCDVTTRDVGGVRAEVCLSAPRNRGDAQRLSATCHGEIFEEIVGIFLCRRDRHKSRFRRLWEVWSLKLEMNRHKSVGYLIRLKQLPYVGENDIRADVESSWRFYPDV